MKRYVTIAWSIVCLIIIIHDWSNYGSYILGMMAPVWLVGLVVIVIVFKAFGGSKDENEKNQNGISEDTRICPKCAESVKEKAKICRYCNFEFTD